MFKSSRPHLPSEKDNIFLSPSLQESVSGILYVLLGGAVRSEIFQMVGNWHFGEGIGFC